MHVSGPFRIALFLLPLVVLSGCQWFNQPDYPEVTTTMVTDITQTSATTGGVIITDGNSEITEKGVCWNLWGSPSIYGDHTVDGSGSGSFTSLITGLSDNTTYYVAAYATNEVGTSYGTTLTFVTGNGGGNNTCTDIDGNTYSTVTIGTQVWMAENLKVTRYRNGDLITYVSDASAWSSLSAGGYCYYDNLTSNAITYGNLYNWAAVNDSRNLAPPGWHVPTYDEWNTLITYLGGSSVAGGKMKETGNLHWNAPNNATNESGFTALGGGLRDQLGNYFAMGYNTYWWSTTSEDPTYSWAVNNTYDQTLAFPVVYEKPLGFPIRCVKD